MSGAEAEDAVRAPEIDRMKREHTILVVEDDDDVRAYTVELIRELGYRVLEAHDGPAALRLLEREEQAVDLLFTDVVMPGMSGRELADLARGVQPDLKVVYTSGYTRNAIVHGGRLDSGVEIIAKPFTYQSVAEKLADVLDAGGTDRGLIVEPDPTDRMLAVEALKRAGYAIDEAATASEALGRVRAAQGRYDFVLLGARLPDKAGLSLAMELRALHTDLPLLIAAGEDTNRLLGPFAADRCTGVIGKPYGAAELQTALAALGVRCNRPAA
jgi:CheY-like chemotaxis protein